MKGWSFSAIDLPPYFNVDLFLARDGLGLPD
jgi:hypothetical protein